MPQPPARPIARLFLALTGISWALIAFGGLVRAKKAGLSCPDWPLCHGDVVPDIHLEGVIYEFGHRALAGGVSLLFVAGAVMLWRQPALWARMRGWIFAGGGLLATQIIFGGLTVLIVHHGDGEPRPETWPVVGHLLLGNAFAAVILLTGLRLRELARGESAMDGEPVANSARLATWLWLVAMLAQFVLGGMVSGNIAGLVCTEFPTCNGGVWFPQWTGLVGLQIFHRLNAYLLFALALTLWLTTRKRGQLSRVTALLAILVTVQAVLGAVNVVSYLHTSVTTAHSLVAALLFSASAVLMREMARRRG